MIYLAGPLHAPGPGRARGTLPGGLSSGGGEVAGGIAVFSPIAHTDFIAACGLPLDWSFWRRYGRVLLEMCSEVWVLTLDGWRESQGRQTETALAGELGKPVVLVEPEVLNDRTPARAGAAVGME